MRSSGNSRRARSALAAILCVVSTACAPTQPAGDQLARQEERVLSRQEAPAAADSAPPAAREEVNFVRARADEQLESILRPDMTADEQVKAIYDFAVRALYFTDPVGLDMWWYLSDQTTPPSYIENRSLSPLLYRAGSCEDFAAVVVVLLQQAGFSSEYVAGYTISVNGGYVDHAWAVVELAGNWYHLDPQLEQNVVRDGELRYRFFLKTDEEMLPDHKWGENLLAYWPDISAQDAAQIRREFTPPPCDMPYPPLEAEPVFLPARPDLEALALEMERQRAESGKPPPEGELQTQPPVLITTPGILP